MLTTILRRLLLYVIPAVLIFISNEKFKVKFNDEEEIDALIKAGLFFAGAIISYGIVPIITERDKKRVQDLSKSVKILLGTFRKTVSDELAKKLITTVKKRNQIRDIKLNIRIFVPKHKSIKSFFKRERFFKLQSYEGLCVSDIENLKFQVSPKKKGQGLISQVYNEKE